MIITHTPFGFGFDGNIFDTAIASDMLDEITLYEGVYDRLFITLDMEADIEDTVQDSKWTMKTIMDAHFRGDLDAGSVSAQGFDITHIQMYRTVEGTGTWDAIAQFPYNEEFNVYEFIDRYPQNGATYQYAIVPVANEIIGDRLESDPVEASFDSIFITDRDQNRKLEFDVDFGTVSHNTQSAVNQPINGQFPIVTFGNSNYKTGQLTVLPLSRETIAMAGGDIDKFAEQVNREAWMDFLNNGRAKVLRLDSGVNLLVVTTNASIEHKDGGDVMRNLANISFDYTEIGRINFAMMHKNGLIPTGFAGVMSYDDMGGIISNML